MTSAITSRRITPSDILSVYPGADLIPIEPPEENEDFKTYVARVGADAIRECGDTLLAFIMLECAITDGEPKEIAHLMGRAVTDVVSVLTLANEREIT